MLDFADVVAINKFERRGAEDAHARRRPPAGPQPRGVRQAARRHAGLRHQRGDVQRRRRHRALPAPARAARRPRAAARRGRAPPGRRPALLEDPAGGAAASGSATSPRSPRPCAATTPAPTSWSSRPAGSSGSTTRWPRCDAGASKPPRPSSRRWQQRRGTSSTTRRRQAARGVAVRRPGVRRAPRPRVAVRQPDPAGRAAGVRRPRRAGEVLAPREPARPLPLHRRRVPVQARERGPGPDVRRRGRPGAHQPPVQGALRGPARRPGSPRRSTR